MRRMNGDQDGVFERRKIAAFAKFQFLLDVTGKIVVARELDRGRKGGIALHENFAWCLAPPGTSRHLRQ